MSTANPARLEGNLMGVRHKRLSKLVGASNEEIVEILGLPPSAVLGIKHRMHEIYQDFECSDEMSRW